MKQKKSIISVTAKILYSYNKKIRLLPSTVAATILYSYNKKLILGDRTLLVKLL